MSCLVFTWSTKCAFHANTRQLNCHVIIYRLFKIYQYLVEVIFNVAYFWPNTFIIMHHHHVFMGWRKLAIAQIFYVHILIEARFMNVAWQFVCQLSLNLWLHEDRSTVCRFCLLGSCIFCINDLALRFLVLFVSKNWFASIPKIFYMIFYASIALLRTSFHRKHAVPVGCTSISLLFIFYFRKQFTICSCAALCT